MKLASKALVSVVLAGIGTVGAAAPAKIGTTRARAIATKAAPGKVVDAEYEKEGGGWRYSFDIRQGSRIHEIGVDAFTGKIVEDKFEALNSRD